MEQKPVISIIGTIYNQANLAERTLEVWCRQKFDLPYEIIVLDDGSDDGTREMVTKMDQKYPGLIRYFYFNEPNLIRNCTLLFNAAITRFARANIICVQWYDRIPSTFDALNHLYWPHLESDDKFISFQHRHIAGSSSRDVIEFDKLDELLDSVKWREDPMQLSKIMGEPGAHCYPDGMCESACFSFHKKHFLAIKGYDERYFRVANYSNVELWGRFKKHGLDFTITDDFTFHQPHPANRLDIQVQLEPDSVIVRNTLIRQDFGKILAESEVLEDQCDWTILSARPQDEELPRGVENLYGDNFNAQLAKARGANVLFLAPEAILKNILPLLPEVAEKLARPEIGCVGPDGGLLPALIAGQDAAEGIVDGTVGLWLAFDRKAAVRNALRLESMDSFSLSMTDFCLQMRVWAGRRSLSLAVQPATAIDVPETFGRRWEFLSGAYLK